MPDVVLILIGAALVTTPGLLILVAGRVTGWWLAMAPLVTYTLVAVTSNLDELTGWRIGWSTSVLAAVTAAVALAVMVLCRKPWKWHRNGSTNCQKLNQGCRNSPDARQPEIPPNRSSVATTDMDELVPSHTSAEAGQRESAAERLPGGYRRRLAAWFRSETWPVLASVGGVFVVIAASLWAMGDLSRPHQDYDTAFHLSAIDILHDYRSTSHHILRQDLGIGESVLYYPVGWHAMAALLQGLTGCDTAAVMNASMIVAALPAVVGMSAFVRQYAGSRWLAGLTALGVATGIGFPFDIIRHGPLTGLLCGISLIPALLLALLWALRRTRTAVFLKAVVLGGGVGALLFIHPGAAMLAYLCGAGLVVQLACAERLRWWKHWLTVLVPSVCIAGALSVFPVLHTREVMKSIHGLMNWPEHTSVLGAVVNLASGQSFSYDRQYGVLVLTCVGLLAGLRFWRRWLWLLGVLGLIGGLYIIAAAVPGEKAALITSWWWNDARRLLSCFVILGSVLTALAVAACADVLLSGKDSDETPNRMPRWGAKVVATTLTLVPVMVHTLSLSAQLTSQAYANESRLSAEERKSWQLVGKQLGPNARVLNDPGDGSAYARSLAGVDVVGQRNIGPITYGVPPSLVQGQLDEQHSALWRNFRELATDPGVRRHVREAGITHVVLGSSHVDRSVRPIGLMGLAESAYLERMPDIGSLQVWRVNLPDEANISS